MGLVISKACYKGKILQRNSNYFVKFHGKKNWENNMTVKSKSMLLQGVL